jgi:hypothetical protein
VVRHHQIIYTGPFSLLSNAKVNKNELGGEAMTYHIIMLLTEQYKLMRARNVSQTEVCKRAQAL